MTYKISVIIPIYKVEDYIKECLDSLVNQTIGIENIEVLAVDNATPDNSMEIVKQYQEKYPSIKILTIKENNGPGPARNLGMKHVTAPYATFLDSDDIISENAYEVCLKEFEENQADLVMFKAEIFNEDGPINENPDVYSKNRTIEDLYQYPELIFYTNLWNKIYPKKLYPYLKFPESILYDDNVASASVVTKSKKTIITTDTIYYHRRHDLATTQTITKKNSLDLIASVNPALNLINETPEYENLIKFFALKILYSSINFMINDIKDIDDIKEVYNELKEYVKKFPPETFTEFKKYFPNYQLVNQQDKLYDIEKLDIYQYLIKHKYQKQLEKEKYQANLYINTGKGFNETDKITIHYDNEKITNLKFNLEDYKNIEELRFDPIEGYASKIRIINIESDNNHYEVITSNSQNPVTDEKQLFLTTDPQYLINGYFENLKTLKITLQIEVFTHEQLLEEINNKNNEIKDLKNKINELETQKPETEKKSKFSLFKK